MKGKQWLAVALACTTVAACGAMTACGGNGGGGGEPPKTDEKTWHSLEENELVQIRFAGRDNDTERLNYQAFVNEFNDTHDNIYVQMDWYSDGTAYNTALDGMGKNLPDVFMLQNATGMFNGYASAGKLANIRNYVDESVMSDLYSDAYDIYYYDHAAKRLGYSENAAFYGLPKDMGPYALAVNETLLKSTVQKYNTANPSDQLDLNRIMSTDDPMNYTEFLDIGKKLKSQLSGNQYVLAGYNLESAVYSNHADYYERTDEGWKETITSDNFVGALQFYQNLYKEGILPAAGTESSADTTFTSGRGLFYYVGPWTTKDWWNTCTSFEWNILPVIAGTAEGAVSTAYVGGMCYAISNNSQYKDAALEFATFLSTNVTSQRTQYKRGQCIPNLKSLAAEFSGDSLGLIAQQSGKTNPNPLNRSVWIDVVDGAGQKTNAGGETYTDKVAGRYSTAAYTISNSWLTHFNNYIGGSTNQNVTLWKTVGGNWLDVKTVLEGYRNQLQAELNDMWRRY